MDGDDLTRLIPRAVSAFDCAVKHERDAHRQFATSLRMIGVASEAPSESTNLFNKLPNFLRTEQTMYEGDGRGCPCGYINDDDECTGMDFVRCREAAQNAHDAAVDAGCTVNFSMYGITVPTLDDANQLADRSWVVYQNDGPAMTKRQLVELYVQGGNTSIKSGQSQYTGQFGRGRFVLAHMAERWVMISGEYIVVGWGATQCLVHCRTCLQVMAPYDDSGCTCTNNNNTGVILAACYDYESPQTTRRLLHCAGHHVLPLCHFDNVACTVHDLDGHLVYQSGPRSFIEPLSMPEMPTGETLHEFNCKMASIYRGPDNITVPANSAVLLVIGQHGEITFCMAVEDTKITGAFYVHVTSGSMDSSRMRFTGRTNDYLRALVRHMRDSRPSEVINTRPPMLRSVGQCIYRLQGYCPEIAAMAGNVGSRMFDVVFSPRSTYRAIYEATGTMEGMDTINSVNGGNGGNDGNDGNTSLEFIVAPNDEANVPADWMPSTISRDNLQLLVLWTDFCDFILRILFQDSRPDFVPMVIFRPGVRAVCVQKDNEIFMGFNPILVDKSDDLWFHELLQSAIHEATHLIYSSHNEDFVGLVQKIGAAVMQIITTCNFRRRMTIHSTMIAKQYSTRKRKSSLTSAAKRRKIVPSS